MFRQHIELNLSIYRMVVLLDIYQRELDQDTFLGNSKVNWRFRWSLVINLHVMVLVSEVANYVLYHSIAKVQRNELFQKGFLIDGIKCLRIVSEYWYYLIATQSFSKGYCRMTLTKTRMGRVVDSRLFDVADLILIFHILWITQIK